MSIAYSVLGSGSRGNASIVMLDGEPSRLLLVDAGLGPRTCAKRMAPLGLSTGDIGHIIVTHFDRDHFSPSWRRSIERFNIVVHAHRQHRAALDWLGISHRHVDLFDGPFEISEHTRLKPLMLSHDARGSVGYVIENRDVRLGWATDLGRVPDVLLEHFAHLDGVAIESNYDRALQLASRRPASLKRRIMGGAGHLSNDQSFRAVQRLARDGSLSSITLLHLSRECNDPRLIKRLYARRAARWLDRLTITSQYTPSPVIQVERALMRSTGAQYSLF